MILWKKIMPVCSDISTSLGVKPRKVKSHFSSGCALLITHLSNPKFNDRNLMFTSGQEELKYQLFFIHAALSNSFNCLCKVILLPPSPFLLLFRTESFSARAIHPGFWSASFPAETGVSVNCRKPELVNFWFAWDHHGLLFWRLLKECSNPWCHANSRVSFFQMAVHLTCLHLEITWVNL